MANINHDQYDELDTVIRYLVSKVMPYIGNAYRYPTIDYDEEDNAVLLGETPRNIDRLTGHPASGDEPLTPLEEFIYQQEYFEQKYPHRIPVGKDNPAEKEVRGVSVSYWGFLEKKTIPIDLQYALAEMSAAASQVLLEVYNPSSGTAEERADNRAYLDLVFENLKRFWR